MIKKKSIAIIPARAGSKRLPNKNILELNNKPLIIWTIEAAKKSGEFDEIVVSTDSKEIQNIAIKNGVSSPFLRPEKLSNDTATSFDVVKHCLDFYKQNLDTEFEFITLLQPTSPLRDEKDITGAFDTLNNKNGDAVISVCEVEHSPLWSNTIDDSGSLSNFIRKEVKGKRSQDLPKYYRLNGAIYICKIDNFLSEKTFFILDNIFSYKMDTTKSVDIDNEIDFKLAELLINQINEHLSKN